MWMGGAAAAGGNATSWAEANAFYDPEAAHVVLSAGLPITIYTWDVYLKVMKISQTYVVELGVNNVTVVRN